MPGNQITFGVGFNVNESGLNKLKQSLQEIQKLTTQDLLATGNFKANTVNRELASIKNSASQVQAALTKAFNPQLGTTNVSKFNQEMQKLDIGKIASQFNSLGSVGQTAFLNLTRQSLALNTPLKQNVSWLTKMGETLANTVKWRIATTAVNGFTSAIQGAFNYIKALDSSLTDIRIVTGQSRDEMAAFADQANVAAQALGRQTKEYTNAALAYYQQGLNTEEVQQRTEATLKAQNITGAGTEMTDYLTAVWNGYKVVNEEIELYVDKLAAVADSSASNMAELATGMSKVAATANNMGVDIDQLTAQLATIIATTRQAPETVGNALKTIYARINDIKAGTDEADISLGNYTKKMASLGFNVLDSNNQLRATGEVMEEIGARWQTLTREQQVYLAQTMAGQRQMNNLIALFDSWEQYSEMLNVSLNAQGTLNEKNARYMDSVTAHINQFKAATEGMQQALLDPEGIMDVYDAGTKLMELLTSFIESIGGMKGVLIGLGALGTQVFGKQITEAIHAAIINITQFQTKTAEAAARIKATSFFDLSQFNINNNTFVQANQQLIDMYRNAERYRAVMSDADQVAINGFLEQQAELDTVILKYQDLLKEATALGNININNPNNATRAALDSASFQVESILKNLQFGKDGSINFEHDVKEVERLIASLDLLKARFTVYQKDVKNVDVKGIQQANKAYQEQKRILEELQNTQGKTIEQSGNATQIANAADKLKELEQVLRQAQQPLDDLKTRLTQLTQDESVFGKETETVRSIITNLTPENEDLAVTLEQLMGILNRGSGDAQRLAQELRNMIPTMEQLKDKSEQTRFSFQQFFKTLDTKALAANLTGLLQGVSSLAMGIQSLNSVMKTYQQVVDGSIDKSEGYLQIIMGLSMGLPMLISGVGKLGTSLSGLGTAIAGAIPALGGLATAATGANASLLALAGTAGIALVAILAVVAVGYGLVKLYQSLTKEAQEYKRQQKILEDSKKKYEELKTVQKELADTFDRYKDAKDAIDKLTAGTQEWRDAISSANDYAQQLLKVWPKLRESMWVDENGEIHFKEGSVEAAQQEADINAARQGVTSVVTERNTRAAAVDSAASQWWNNNTELNKQVAEQLYETPFRQALEAIKASGSSLQQEIEKAYGEGFTGTYAQAIIKQLDLAGTTAADALLKFSDREVYALLSIEDQLNSIFSAFDDFHAADENFASDIQLKLIDYVKSQSDKYVNLTSALMALDVTKGASVEDVIKQYQNYSDKAANYAELLDNNVNLIRNLEHLLSGGDTFIADLTKAEMDILEKIIKNINDPKLSANFNLASDDWENQLYASLESLPNKLQSAIKFLFEKSTFEELASPELVEKIGQAYNQIYQKLGSQALIEIDKIFNNLPADKVQNFLDILMSAFTQGMSLPEFTNQLSEAKIDLTDIGFTTQEIYESLKLGSQETFETIAEKYKEAKDVIDGLQFGEGIDAEDAKKIEDLGINLDDFFMMGAEGEQILIGKAEELRDAVDKIQMSRLYEEMQAAGKEGAELDYILQQIANHGADATSAMKIPKEAQTQVDYLDALVDRNMGVDLDRDMIEGWQAKINSGSMQPEDYEAIAAAMEKNINLAPVLREEQQKLAQEYWNCAEALNSFKLKLDEDVDQDQWEDLTKTISENATAIEELSDHLAEDKIQAGEVAEAILRYDNAIQDVTDHYEDWVKALNSGVLEDQSKAFEEMRDAYGDLLDLDGDVLSDSFLKSAENLQDLKAAAEGSEEAYNNLMQAAQQDIASQLSVDFDISDFQAKFDDLLAQYYQVESLDDLQIGAELNDENFLNGLTEMVNAAGMSAEQATAYLASMGVDAEVIETDDPVTETHETGDYTAQPHEIELPYSIPYGDGTGVSTNTGKGYVTVPEYIPETNTFETTDEKKAVSLKVTSAHKSSGGGFKHSQASNGAGGGGKKGGGGGGKNKQPKQKTTKKFKAKIDPYHDVNIKIGDVKEGLDKLQKQRDKLIGKDAVDNLAKQIELLEREKELLQEKAKIAQQELQKQAEELAQQGAIIDNQGNILNYNQLLKDKQDQINRAIEIANGLTDEQQEAYLKYVDQLKEEYKELEEGIKNLDDTKQLLDDLGADYQDLINQQIELAIEAFDLKINVELDLQDAERDFNEFRKKVIDKVKDDEHGRLAEAAARNYAQYYNPEGGLVPSLTNHVNQIQKEIEIIRNGGFSQIYGDNLAAAAEDLKKYNDELMNALEEAQEVIDETHDHFLDAIDAMNDAFDTQQENLDKIDDLLQHDMDILQLIHGEENYDEMQNLWNQQVAQDNARLQALQQEQQYWRDRLDQYEEGTEEWKRVMENWQDAFEKTNDAMLNAVQNLQSRWENSVNSIMTTLRNQVYGGNMTAALENWDKMLWHDEKYLDPLERATGLLNLQNKYRDAIRGTNDPKLQQKLTELEEKQLKALAEKEHLREIDLKISEQQLAVLQAQMALEDAQQAKTKLRLRRDSQGNYTYQYVADEENIEEKTQEYAQALAEYREMVKDSLHEDLQDMSDYFQEFADKLQDAAMKFGIETQEFAEEEERLTEMYYGPDGYITRLREDSLTDMTNLQEATFAQALGLNEVLAEDIFDKFLGPDSISSAVHELLESGGEIPSLIDSFLNDSALKAFDTISNEAYELLSGPEGLVPEVKTALWNIVEYYDTKFVPDVVNAMNYLQKANLAYVEGLGVIENTAGRTTQNIATGLAFDTFYTNSLNSATDALLQTQDAQLQSAEKVYESLKKNEEAFRDQTLAATDAANAMFLYWLALNGGVASSVPYSVEGLSNVNIQVPRITAAAPAYSGGDYGGGNYGGGGSGSGSTGAASSSAAATTSSGVRPYSNPNFSYQQTNINTGQRYATGGYTGDWNSSPRLVWLDQKELVLNAEDTKNMLDAVQIVRTIADKVSAATTAAAASIGGGGLLDLVSAAGEQILQNVVINADFPAVQDAAQIKQAFNELVNLASQRASGNRRTY